MNKIIAIAINDYSDLNISNLSNCVNDINAIIDVLSNRYLFDTVELFTKPEQTTHQFLYRELYDQFINSLEGDNILVIYAGHGEFNPVLEASYWLCSNSIKSDVTTWFNISDLLSFFKASPSKHIALISDSCFSGAIFERKRGGGFSALHTKNSRQALTSGGIEKVLDGPPNKNSPFNLALCKVLSENEEMLLSFSQFSERAILAFDEDSSQTPSAGPLTSSSDRGGEFFFSLKLKKDDTVKSIQIPLEISDKVNIYTDFEIPFFNKNDIFDSAYVNVFVQNLGYSIVNDVRVFVAGDEGYSIKRSKEFEFSIYVNYSIECLNDKLLSIVINRNDYFGGAHPNHYIYSLNFAFRPVRKIGLEDIVDYSGYNTLTDLLLKMANKYEEDECRDTLLGIVEHNEGYDYLSNLDFSIGEEYFCVYFMDHLPHAFKACGILKIPINEINLKV